MSSGDMQYESAIVSFLDILGFRMLVANSSCGKINSLLDKVLDFSGYEDREDAITEFSITPYVYVFSDSIIRVRPYNREGNRQLPYGVLFHELNDLVLIQGVLAYNGLMIRGAVTYGNIYVTPDRAFGPALIRAYELENNCAFNPRIIVDPDLMLEFRKNTLLRSEHHTLDEETNYVNRLVKVAEDGFTFVDYLRAMDGETDPVPYTSFLQKHREFILDSSKGVLLPRNAASKIMWLVRYHNDLITSLPDEFYSYNKTDRDTILIKDDEIRHIQKLQQ